MSWWKFWDPDKNPGKGKGQKPTGGKAGSGRVADTPSGHNNKKSITPSRRRGMDGRVK